jgi:hypothetical protein
MTMWKNAGLSLVVIACQAVAGAAGSTAGGHQHYSIVDFGAVGDGRTLSTANIQRAIDRAHGRGGGTVVIPDGIFLCGSIVLRSGVTLHLQKGATLLGSTHPVHYERTAGHPGLIVADSAIGIAITGEGTIDGQGLQLALTIDSLHAIGQFSDPEYNRRRMRPSEGVRPHIINLSRCANVTVRSVTMKNGAGWVQTYTRCTRVTIDSVTVNSTAFWNNDGLDICDCTQVTVARCNINAADDAICLKSMARGLCNDSISISDCTLRSSASAIKFGTDSWGGFRNISVRRITVYDTYRSAIALECVDGGTLANVLVEDVRARNTGNALFIRLGHRNPDSTVSTLRNVTVKNLTAEIPFGRPDIDYDLRGPDLPFFHNTFPASITGIPGHPVENVTLTNIGISYPGRGTRGMAYVPLWDLDRVPEAEKEYPEFSMLGELPAWGLYVRHVNSLSVTGMTLRVREKDYRPAFAVDDAKNLSFIDSVIEMPDAHQAIVLRNVKQARLAGVSVNGQNDRAILQLGSCDTIGH